MRKETTVSIILTTFNCRDTIRYTLTAIEKQSYAPIEVVIKDGGSRDRTLSLANWYRDHSKHRVIVESGPDTGIYDAMNRGYALSTGDIVVFCSDRLTDAFVVADMVEAIEAGGEDCIGAHADLVYAENGKIRRSWHMGEGRIEDGWMAGHPTLFLKRCAYETYGLYRSCYRIAADYDLMVRMLYKTGNRLAYVPRRTVSMYYGGTSTKNAASYLSSFREIARVLKDNRVKNAGLVLFKRTVRLAWQFITA